MTKDNVTRKRYKTIEYSYFACASEDLLLILPGGGANSQQYKSFINIISKSTNVLSIDAGYYGINPFSKKQKAEYSISSFVENLHHLLSTFSYKKLVCIASSYGAIAAICYHNSYPSQIDYFIMANPALYKKKVLSHYLWRFLTFLGIHTSPDFIFNTTSVILKSIRSKRTIYVAKKIESVVNRIGALSFMYCLHDIVRFTTDKQKEIRNFYAKKTTTILSNDDIFFNKLCDERMITNSVIKKVDSNHFIIRNNYTEVAAIVKNHLK